MVSDRTVLPPILCSGFVGYRSWRGINEIRCMYALSILPKRTTPLTELSSGQYSPVFGVPQNVIAVIRHFHDDIMRACVLLDGRVCSGWFAVEQGLRQGCLLGSLLFNIFFAAVINVTYTRFKEGKDGVMDTLVYQRNKNGKMRLGGGGK